MIEYAFVRRYGAHLGAFSPDVEEIVIVSRVVEWVWGARITTILDIEVLERFMSID